MWLKKSLYSTNVIENLQGTLKRVEKIVMRWREGSMVQRCAVAALAEAQRRFRRVKGYRELPQLVAASDGSRSCLLPKSKGMCGIVNQRPIPSAFSGRRDIAERIA